MKKAIVFRTLAFLAVMALFAYPVFAQGGNRPGSGERPEAGQRPGGGMGRQFSEDDVKQRVKRQTELLGLNEDQEKKIMDFELEMYRKNQVERQKHQGDWEAMRTYMQGQRELRDKKYEEVLNEEQFKLYKQNQEGRRERMQRERDGAPGERPGTGDLPERGRGRG